MIVPPSPTSPRSPLRRVMQLGGLVVAPVLLVAAVGAGLAGPKPEPPTPAPSTAPAADGPLQPAPTPAAPRAPTGLGATPSSFAGLNVLTPSEAIALRAGGHAGPLVVSGQLELSEPDAGCDGGDLGPLGPWCPRTGILAEHPWDAAGEGVGQRPAHLHVTLPLGVRAPDVLARMAAASAGTPVPAVVIGRFAGLRCRPSSPTRCEELLAVDRVVWADGVRAALTPVAEDPLETSRRRPNPFQLAVADRQTPLLAVLAWPATVAGLDPATTGSLAPLEASEPVWYLRVLEGEGQGPSSHGGTPAVRWYLLDERRLRVIATGDTEAAAGPAGVPEARTADASTPGIVAGLGVHDVEDLGLTGDDDRSRPVAVGGILRDVRSTGRCADTDADATWYARIALLGTVGRGSAGGDAVTVRIPPGVRIPDATGTSDEARPGPIVVVGQVAPARESCEVEARCTAEIWAERIVAAGDAAADVEPVVERDIPGPARMAAERVRPQAEGLAAGASGAVLGSVLVRGDRLAFVDAVAAQTLGDAVPRQRPVWYSTAVQTSYGTRTLPPGDIRPRITWVVVDAIDGQLLAAGER